MLTPEKAVALCYEIPGQTWPLELRWLYHLGTLSRSHVEVGAYCGRSLMATVLGMPQGATVIAIDSDQPMSDTSLTWVGSVRDATLREITRLSGIQPRFMGMSSLEAARECAALGLKFDSVFIDSSHCYAETMSEIEVWGTLLSEGGTISGHDYWPAHVGVMDAVNEMFEGRFSVVQGTRIWYASPKHMAHSL